MISQTVSSEVDNNETEQEELNWLFVGDFLFYLRLLARQFATLSKEAGGMHKNMLIVPDPETAWEQLAETNCQAMILDCVEASEPQLEFIRGVRQNYPTVRLILVSAVLDRNTEGALMEAGAHLCFSKPRSVEEAAAMYRLVDALTGSRGFYPNGTFRGLAPARFIQFLCARGESGSIAMETIRGEATLVMEQGRIVDASIGDLKGDEAAALILSFDRTQRCRFQHMLTSQYHTIKLDTHQLWRDSGKPAILPAPAASEKPVVRQPKSLTETFRGLDSVEGLSVDFHLEPVAPDGRAVAGNGHPA